MALSDLLKEARPGVAIVGAGAVGTALGLALKQEGYPILGVISRRLEPARSLARRVDAPVFSDDPADLPGNARIVFICVPDDDVELVAQRLATLRHSWRDVLVTHTSGALTASALEPLGRMSAALLAFHPIQTFTRGIATPLTGVTAGLQGDERAVLAGVQIATSLGMPYVVIPEAAKTRYHLAASIASNFLVTLMGLVNEVLGSGEIDQRTGVQMMLPLVRGTLHNIQHLGPEDALTGPIVRGDTNTVSGHSAALREHLPHLLPTYTALASETVRLAVRSSRLDPDQAEHLLDALDAYLETTHPVAFQPPAPPPAEPPPSRLAAGAEGRTPLRKLDVPPPTWERL